jgi:hypothetical protein
VEGVEMRAFVRTGFAIVSLGAVILAGASVANAASGDVAVANLRGPLVNALFSVTDASGCVETDTFVTANLPSSQQLPGPPVTIGVAGVDIFEYDSCTGTTLLDATGGSEALPAGAFQVSKQLDRATLTTTLPMTDIETGSTFNANVNLTFVGTSALYRDDVNSNDFYGGGCHVLNRWKGTGRDASAAGVVSDGSTNYTPMTSVYAEIGFVIDGFEVIHCA